jgi:UDP-N-acetylglucosamine acyltransferase
MAVIGVPAEDGGAPGECIIGQANAIREHVVVYAGSDQPTRLGRDNLIMIASHVGSGAVVGDHGIFANCTYIGGGAVVEDYVRTSAFTVIEPGRTVGAYTFIAGYGGVDRDAPPFAMVQGFPCRVRGVNTHNLRRCGFGQADIRALKSAFRELFNGTDEQVNTEALEKLAAPPPTNPHVRRLIDALVRDRSGPVGGSGGPS